MSKKAFMTALLLSFSLLLASCESVTILPASSQSLPQQQRLMLPLASYAQNQQPMAGFLLRYWMISELLEKVSLSPEDLLAQFQTVANGGSASEENGLSPAENGADQEDVNGNEPSDTSMEEEELNQGQREVTIATAQDVLPGNWRANLTIAPSERERFPFPIHRLLVPFQVNLLDSGEWEALLPASGQRSVVILQNQRVFLTLSQTITLEKTMQVTIDLAGELDPSVPVISGVFQLWIEGDSDPFFGTWQAEKEESTS